MILMTFGDIAVTAKPMPNVVRGSEVQIIKMEVRHGRLTYCAALYDSSGEFVDFIGPYPENAWTLRRNGTPAEVSELLALINGDKKKRK